jgi:hypothetical protein
MGGMSFMIVDGCSRSLQHHPPRPGNALHERASVRCCSQNGASCETSSLGCLARQTWHEANQACTRRGLRLCMQHEVDRCCGTGCGFDGHSIWTNTPANMQHGGHQGFTGHQGYGGQQGGHHYGGSMGVNQNGYFTVVDGCPSAGMAHQPRALSGVTGRAAVRCCSMNGMQCETRSVGCRDHTTFQEANSLCSSRGMRLCYQQELDARRCCGTGCGFDNSQVWTLTPASGGSHEGFQGSR